MDADMENYEAVVSFLPALSGDGYGYGGGAILSIGPHAMIIGEGLPAREMAEEMAARWNAARGRRLTPTHAVPI